ncbi:aldehyde reductase like protein [Zymoseptoria brevis]|uniref:Aldehyde reductase like protein n=1 Tax=Zymoseptoria brevis TaxID=1047168 RepID=A0A0F4GZM3_9PEZI|nr:aldehyde reductase like protein [Zymoseptoria brevis]
MDTTKNIAAKLAGQETALPKGSLILVTGANGYIGGTTGYKVRGTARTEEKAESSKKVFKDNPNLANYETAVVADFAHEGVFDEAVQGCDAVIHVASDTTFGTDPNKVVKPTVAGVLSILRSAAKEKSVQRFVLTSSSTAALLPHPGKEITVSKDDWDQEALDLAWAPPPYEDDRAFPVYAASKVEGEKALWRFMKEEKPSFVANAVLPNYNMGRVIGSAGATGSGVPNLFKGKTPMGISQYMIDVIDDARIHVIAAVLDSSLSNQRIFAFNVPFTWTEITSILRELHPDATTIQDPPENEGRDASTVPNEKGAELLRKWYGQDGYKSLRQSIVENLEGQI